MRVGRCDYMKHVNIFGSTRTGLTVVLHMREMLPMRKIGTFLSQLKKRTAREHAYNTKIVKLRTSMKNLPGVPQREKEN